MPSSPPKIEPVTVEPGTTIHQPTAFPTQKVWAFLASTGFLTAAFGALQDYNVQVQPNTQALITAVLTFVAMYLVPNKAGE